MICSKKYFCLKGTNPVVNHTYIIKPWYFLWNFIKSLTSSKDPGPDQTTTGSKALDSTLKTALKLFAVPFLSSKNCELLDQNCWNWPTLLHSWQRKGFSPVWILTCRTSCEALANPLPQWEHTWPKPDRLTVLLITLSRSRLDLSRLWFSWCSLYSWGQRVTD
jgi:hypothetical protein